MKARLRWIAAAVLAGFLGMGAFALVSTMYQDHETLKQVVIFLNTAQQKAAQAAPQK